MDVAVVIAQTLGSYILVCGIGATLTKYPAGDPYLPKSNLATMGRLSMNVLAPFMIFTSLGANLSMDMVRYGWPVIFWAIMSQMVGVLLTLLMQRVLDMPPSLRRPIMSAMVFGNCGGVPLILLESLSRQSPISTVPGAFKKCTAFIFLYLVSWFISFFGIGVSYLKADWDESGEGMSCKRVLSTMMNPLVAAVVLGLLTGVVSPLQKMFFSDEGALAFFGSASLTIAKPAIGMITLGMSASLGGFVDQLRSSKRMARSHDAEKVSGGEVAPEGTACIDVDMAEPEGSRAAKEKIAPVVDKTSTRDGAGCVQDESQDVDLAQARSAIVGLTVARVLVLPAVNIALVALLADKLLAGSADLRLMKLVLYVQAAVPSADFTILTCQSHGKLRIAEVLSASYIFQYTFGLLPMSIALGIAMKDF